MNSSFCLNLPECVTQETSTWVHCVTRQRHRWQNGNQPSIRHTGILQQTTSRNCQTLDPGDWNIQRHLGQRKNCWFPSLRCDSKFWFILHIYDYQQGGCLLQCLWERYSRGEHFLWRLDCIWWGNVILFILLYSFSILQSLRGLERWPGWTSSQIWVDSVGFALESASYQWLN